MNSVITNTAPQIKLSYINPVPPAARIQVTSSENCKDILRAAYDQDTFEIQEQFVVMFLNHANYCLGTYHCASGSVSGVVLPYKLIWSAALLAGASGIILSHNHPSGNRQPSRNDIDLTKQMKEQGELLDIKVLDHLILTIDSFYSFQDEGLM